MTGYCVGCKQRDVLMTDVKIHQTKNGKYMAKGKHTCGTTVCSIMNKENALNAVNEGILLVKD